MTQPMTIQDLHERAVTLLSETFQERELALRLTTAAGFPGAMLPQFSTPLVFWGRVVEQAARGAMPGGLRPLLETASRIYPHNPSLRAPAERHSSPEDRTPPLPTVPLPSTRRRRTFLRGVLATLALGLIGASSFLAWAKTPSRLEEDPMPLGAPEVSNDFDETIPSKAPPRVQPPIIWPTPPFRRPSMKGMEDPESSKPLEDLLGDSCWLEQRGGISGRVLDERKRPLSDAMVCAWPHDPRAPADTLRTPACTRTDGRGRYRVPVVPGIHDVVASAPEYRPQSSRTRDGYPLPVLPGTTKTGMSFTLERGGRAIHGTVETSAGEPVEGVRVAPLGTVQTVATTDASGEFTVWVHEGIDPEKFAILAWALGYADQVKQLHDDEPLLFVLERESVIVGRVIDERKMPVVRARVGSGTADGRPGSVVRTDEQGAFKLPALARGQYHLWARTDDAEGRLSEAINLEAGRTSAEQVIVLHPLTPPKSKPPAIETGLATDKPRPKLVVVPPRPKKRSDRLVRKILARMLRKCGEGREGTIEVASKFIIDDGSLLSPTITVIGDAAMDPTIEACSLERATKLRFHPRSSPTAFRTAKVKL